MADDATPRPLATIDAELLYLVHTRDKGDQAMRLLLTRAKRLLHMQDEVHACIDACLGERARALDVLVLRAAYDALDAIDTTRRDTTRHEA